jgi:L-alanine-DL-glutamate epimerase-like enolase superfamily enzyme
MRGTARHERWPLKETFGISRGVSTESHVLYVQLEHAGIVAQGEAEAAEYTEEQALERLRECQAFLSRMPQDYTRARLQQDLPAGPVRNAIDCAFWDLESKQRGQRAWEIAGIEEGRIRTLYTIGLDTPEVMAARAAKHADWPWLKVKLGGPGDRERIAAVRRAAPRARLLVDANGGWTLDELNAYAPELAAIGVSVIEQPLAPGADAALAGWKGPLPLCADESCIDRGSLATLPDGCVRELEPGEVEKYTVVRVADEILVDLMAKASGIDYAEASQSVVIHEIDGVPIPFASPELLWRMKCRAGREKDRGDIEFLRQYFAAKGIVPPQV